MEHIVLLLVFVLGSLTGVLSAWLILHTRARFSHQKKISVIQTELATLQEQLQGKKQQVQELESLLENSESEMNSLKAELESELGVKEQTLIPLQQAHTVLRKQASEFETNLKEKIQQVQVLESQLEKTQSEVDRLKEGYNELSQQADIKKRKARISQLESMLKTKDAAFREVQEKFFESQANFKNGNRLIDKSLQGVPKLQKQSAESHDELKQAVKEKITQFEQKLSQPEFSNVVRVLNAAKLNQTFNELKDKELQSILGGFKKKFRNFLGDWSNDIKKQHAQQKQQVGNRLKGFKSHESYSLLVAENDRRNRDELKSILESEGYIVHKVGHGSQALASALEHRPDLIFIDMTFNMSGFASNMSGFESLKRLKQSSKLKEVPIIVITRAENAEKMVPRSIELGFSDFIVRPIQRLELGEKIFQCISQKYLE